MMLQTTVLLATLAGSHSWLNGAVLQRSAAIVHSASTLRFTARPRNPFDTNFVTPVNPKLWATPDNDGKPNDAPKKSPARSKTTQTPAAKAKATVEGSGSPKRRKIEISTAFIKSQQKEKPSEDDANHAYNIPKTGYSLADQLEKENEEQFVTTLTPIPDIDNVKEKELEFIYNEEGAPIGVKGEKDVDSKEQQQHEGVARIDTVSTSGNVGEEPVRWLVSSSPTNEDDACQSYFMIDIPPYSEKLANKIREFMDPNHASLKNGDKPKGQLDAILITNQQCIHYDNSPGVYVTRKSDLNKWKNAFPGIKVVMYRLDLPRECRESVTQVLDGYGPWGWDENANDVNSTFVETGRPLTIEEWDEETKTKVLKWGESPPDENDNEVEDDSDEEDDGLYSKEAIRQREKAYPLLAVYTPGHTFGSITYVFPKRGICCSGYALPLESPTATLDDIDEDDEYGTTYSGTPTPQGPRLDYQGYLATSVSRPRQMSSASNLINDYIDRFRIVLPARGDVVFLDNNEDMRKRELMESVGLYQKIGEIYGRLGIVE